MEGKEEQKSRKEKRKEARSEKQKLRFLSWVQHQGGKNKKPAMASVELSPVEKKPKKEPAVVKKRRRDPEGKSKSKSNFREYLEMEMGAAVGREEDLETERKLAKKLRVKKGKLGGPDDGMDDLFGDLGFGGDFGSDGETKEYDGKVPDDTKLDKKKRKRKKKKLKNDSAEEPGDGGMGIAEDNDDAEIHESEDGKPDVVEPPTVSKTKYVPPSLRAISNSESEEISQLRRRVRGLLNRLSESNVESITQEVASLFRSVPRSVGCQLIGDEVLASCSRGPRGNEQLRIFHMGDIYPRIIF